MDEGTVQRWLAPHPLGKTLITTRSQEYDSLGSQVRLDVLLPDEAYELLTMRREPVRAEEEVSARGIVEDLGYHTLAVDVAGAALRMSSAVLPFADFKEELASSTSDDDVLEFACELVGTLPHGHEASIASTFLKSIDRLESEEGLDFLRLASRLAVAPIPATLISSVFCEVGGLDERSGRRRADLAVNKAERLSLAEQVEGDAGAWSVHTLISRTMRFRDSEPERSEELWNAAVEVLTTAFRNNAEDPRDHADLEPVVTHVRALVDRADDLKTADLAGRVARYDYKRGAYGLAETLYQRECVTTRRMLGREHPDTLTSMNNLAVTLQEQGELESARKIMEEVLETGRRVLGKENPSTLTSMSNLATMLHAQGDLAEARNISEEVLETTRRVRGEEHHDTVASMNNLAMMLHAQDDLAKARNILEEVLETAWHALGEEHSYTLTAMSNLATVLHAQDDLAEARKIRGEVLETRRRVFGSEHPDTSVSAWNLLVILAEIGDRARAMTVLENDLLWLLGRDPASLGADQRRIREWIREVVSRIAGQAE
jgi:tetratricopeptide (TPR) repeat protein